MNNKSDCSKHKRDLFGETDMKVVAEMIGDLHYESLTELFHYLENKLWIDSQKDKANGKTDLSSFLVNACDGMGIAHQNMQKAWQISKPFMENKTEQL